MKALRLVNWRFNDLILRDTNFINQTLVNLPHHRLSPSIFGSSSTLWKHFRIEHQQVHQGNTSEKNMGENWSWFYPLLTRAQSLTFTMEKISTKEVSSDVDFVCVPPLNDFLVAPEKLQELNFNTDFLINPSVVNQLKNLSSSAKDACKTVQVLSVQKGNCDLENISNIKRQKLNTSISLLCPLFHNING